MVDIQQGDVKLFQTNDDGEIEVEDGIATMSGGLETSAYLSLFGGNEDDDGRATNPLNWWGNLDEHIPSRQYRSETQHLLRSLPATTGNLLALSDAVQRDLAWMLEESVASSITDTVTIPGVNKIKISVSIEALGEENTFNFVQNWKSTL